MPANTPAWLLASLAVAGYTVMSACAKEASKTLSFWEVAHVRAGGGALFALAYALLWKRSLAIQNRSVMALRTLTGAAALLSTFYALAHAPLADSVALFNLTPVFLAGLAPWLLRERFEPGIALCIGLALVGTLLVVRPSTAGVSAGHLVALVGAVLSAFSMISLRKLGSSETAEGVVFWFQAVTAVVLLALGASTFRVPNGREALLLAGCAASGTFAQIMMTHAYARERAARVAALSYLQIPASVILGLVAFGELPKPAALAGIGLILGAGGMVVFLGAKKA